MNDPILDDPILTTKQAAKLANQRKVEAAGGKTRSICGQAAVALPQLTAYFNCLTIED